jgi:hypothetical protein
MNTPQDPEAAETDQKDSIEAVDLPRLVRDYFEADDAPKL